MRWDQPYDETVGKFTQAQVASRGNWNRVGWDVAPYAATHRIHVTPAGSTTITAVNMLEPASLDEEDGALESPGSHGTLHGAARP